MSRAHDKGQRFPAKLSPHAQSMPAWRSQQSCPLRYCVLKKSFEKISHLWVIGFNSALLLQLFSVQGCISGCGGAPKCCWSGKNSRIRAGRAEAKRQELERCTVMRTLARACWGPQTRNHRVWHKRKRRERGHRQDCEVRGANSAQG